MTDVQDAMTAGVDAAADPDPARASAIAREKAEVKRWFQRLDEARKFDEPAREQYAKDRKYARGDSGFKIDDNIVGTNIDILESFLYAKDPDLDVRPGMMVRPPSAETLRDALEEQVAQSPEVLQAGQQAAAMAVVQGLPQDKAIMAGQMASDLMTDKLIAEQVEQLRKRYARRHREIKGFAETCEIVGSRMWQDAQLKRRGRPWVRSELTIGVGILKASWQERTAQSPETLTAINDLQANIEQARSLAAQIDSGEAGFIPRLVDGVQSVYGGDKASKVADLERQLAALQGQVERVIARGYVVDCVQGEDFQVAPGYTVANHLDAPWNAHRIFMRYDDALAEFGPHLSQYAKPEDKLRPAVRYKARKPEMVQDESGRMVKLDAKDADAYEQGESDDASSVFVALWEIWDCVSNTVLTGIEGVHCWVKPGWTPPATTRFYPFFLVCDSEVDGQRHPQSKVTRAAKLVDEYNRIASDEAKHRQRCIPKTAFNAGLLPQDEADKLAKAGVQEMVALALTQPQTPIGNVLYPVAYANMDPALYDRTRIMSAIERIFGTHEALAGSIEVEKTATEAEIQQTGFQARTGGQRDKMEDSLSALAQYTIEIARVYLTPEDVQAIAGPDAFWPAYGGPDDLSKMVNISIRAGSSGKPNTSAERQAISTMLPIFQNGVVQIGQLRGATPQAIADSLEYLLGIVAEKSGDRYDLDQLIPRADTSMPQLPGAMPGAAPVDPNAPPGTNPAQPPQDPAALAA